jgi:hypothetical protein
LGDFQTLGDYLSEKKDEGWVIGVGFKVKGESNSADYITGKDYIPVVALTENGIDYSQKDICEIEFFDRPRKKEIYSPPNILIREIVGKRRIPLAFNTNYLTFPIGIVSIHAPNLQKEELKKLYAYLNEQNELLRFYIIATSGRMMIGKATSINKNDLMKLPYSKELSFSDAEKIIVNDVTELQAGIVDINSVIEIRQIQRFSEIFCKTLNSIYQKEKSFQLFKIIDAGKYFALHFEYASEKLHAEFENADDIEKYIESVIPSRKESKESTHIQKIIKVYGQDSIILAKPKQLRYWLPSIALRDADETFADYVKSRYYNA